MFNGIVECPKCKSTIDTESIGAYRTEECSCGYVEVYKGIDQGGSYTTIRKYDREEEVW